MFPVVAFDQLKQKPNYGENTDRTKYVMTVGR